MSRPPFLRFPVLNGQRLILRDIRHEDIADIAEIVYYNAVPAGSMAEAREMLAKIEENYREGSCVHWGVADRGTDRLAGTCGYYRGFENNTGEIGCVLLPGYRGKGLMSEALSLVVEFGFQQLQLDKITAYTGLENVAAQKLLDRLSFVQESAGDSSDDLLYVLERQR